MALDIRRWIHGSRESAFCRENRVCSDVGRKNRLEKGGAKEMKTRSLLLIAVCRICGLTGWGSPARGAVCFTFDDYHGENWLKADPLFKKYGAHATFLSLKKSRPKKLKS